MGTMKDSMFHDIDTEIESMLRESPLMEPPSDMYRSIMRQVNQLDTIPAFHVTWMDLAVSIAGSLSVAVFLIYILFMPAHLQEELFWFIEWVGYLSRSSMVWIVPCLASAAVLAAGYTTSKCIHASGL